MATGRIGLTTISNDPYLYVENQFSNTVSCAFGIDSTIAAGGVVGMFVNDNPNVSTTTVNNLVIGFYAATQNLFISADFGTPGTGTIQLNSIMALSYYNSQAQNALLFTGSANTATSQLQYLAPGTAGKVLTSAGAALPIWADIGASSLYQYVTTNHAASPYTALSTDFYISADVTGGVVTVKLPDAPSTGRAFAIKDKIGNASVNNITVTTVTGAVTIDGSTSYVINTNYHSVLVIFNGVSYEVW